MGVTKHTWSLGVLMKRKLDEDGLLNGFFNGFQASKSEFTSIAWEKFGFGVSRGAVKKGEFLYRFISMFSDAMFDPSSHQPQTML